MRFSDTGVPEADAASAKWTDDYLETKMKACQRCNVMKSGTPSLAQTPIYETMVGCFERGEKIGATRTHLPCGTTLLRNNTYFAIAVTVVTALLAFFVHAHRFRFFPFSRLVSSLFLAAAAAAADSNRFMFWHKKRGTVDVGWTPPTSPQNMRYREWRQWTREADANKTGPTGVHYYLTTGAFSVSSASSSPSSCGQGWFWLCLGGAARASCPSCASHEAMTIDPGKTAVPPDHTLQRSGRSIVFHLVVFRVQRWCAG